MHMNFLKSINKKTLIIISSIAGVLIIALLVFVIAKENNIKKAQKEAEIQQQIENQKQDGQNQNGVQVPTEDDVQAQLKELQDLREKQGTVQVDEQKAQQDLKQLNELQKQAAAAPVSQESAQSQLDQLNKLRTSGK